MLLTYTGRWRGLAGGELINVLSIGVYNHIDSYGEMNLYSGSLYYHRIPFQRSFFIASVVPLG